MSASRVRLCGWLLCAAAPAVVGCATGGAGAGGGGASSSAHATNTTTSASGPGGHGGSGGHGGTGGHGGCQTDTDCPPPSSACVTVSCEAGACKAADAQKGTACATDGGGMLCNGAGVCVQCLHMTDCPDGESCSSTNTCVMPSCTDGVQDGAESDVDCGGGTCPPCAVGKMCLIDADCASGACDVTSFTCTENLCSDHLKDGTETDVDCGGGTCPGCGAGKMCLVDADCASNACDAVSLTCVSALCNDGMKDGSETDVDCGGGCSPCANGKGCSVDQDCVSRGCDLISHTCQADPCADHRKDGLETGVDCGGGVCAPCADGGGCNVATDCVSHNCSGISCAPNVLVGCADGVKDITETDVDCGGSQCPACALGKGCNVDTDCASNACDATSHVCVASSCADHRKDGIETDVDCGGGVCPGCAAGQRCATSRDCAAGLACAGSPPVCG